MTRYESIRSTNRQSGRLLQNT